MTGQFEGALGIEDVLAREGVYVGTTAGVSMWPLLRHRRDTVVVEPCAGRLRVHDVPLYRRGDAYVLHRIVEVRPDSYVICGDNCVAKERGVTDEQILGVLAGLYRDDRPVSLDSRRLPRLRAYVVRALPGAPRMKRARAKAARALRSAKRAHERAAVDRARGRSPSVELRWWRFARCRAR